MYALAGNNGFSKAVVTVPQIDAPHTYRDFSEQTSSFVVLSLSGQEFGTKDTILLLKTLDIIAKFGI